MVYFWMQSLCLVSSYCPPFPSLVMQQWKKKSAVLKPQPTNQPQMTSPNFPFEKEGPGHFVIHGNPNKVENGILSNPGDFVQPVNLSEFDNLS